LLSDIAVDLLVNQADPPQYVAQDDADWLVAQIGAHPLPYRVEIRLLTSVLQYVVSLPSSLSGFCLAEIENAVVDGRPDHPARQITPEDIEFLRKSVYAADEGASLHVTKAEAESLFHIAHATAGQAPDPTFDTFFAEAVGNYLLGIAFHWTPSKTDELQLEHFENAPASGLSGFLAAMINLPSLPTGADLASVDTLDEAREVREDQADEKERAEAERLDQQETIWLFAHLTRKGELTSAERALLVFLKPEANNPPKNLLELCARMGV
jgi:hypothetical protein